MTRRLSNDYSRCANKECPLRGECLRALDAGDPDYQSISEFQFESYTLADPLTGEPKTYTHCDDQIEP